MSPARKNLLVYTAKCIAATWLVMLLAQVFHYQEVIWPLVSALLVLSPESADALALAATRIGANIIGGVTSLMCLLLGPASMLTVSMALVLTIGLCALCRLIAGSRSALAAVIVIMLHEQGGHPWDAALRRAGSVIAGCLLGLLVTLAIDWRLTVARKEPRAEQAE